MFKYCRFNNNMESVPINPIKFLTLFLSELRTEYRALYALSQVPYTINSSVSSSDHRASSIEYRVSSIEKRASSIQYRVSSIQLRVSLVVKIFNIYLDLTQFF